MGTGQLEPGGSIMGDKGFLLLLEPLAVALNIPPLKLTVQLCWLRLPCGKSHWQNEPVPNSMAGKMDQVFCMRYAYQLQEQACFVMT